MNSRSVQLNLTNELPDHPSIQLYEFPNHTLYPSTESTSSTSDAPFPTASRFFVPMPPDSPLPGTLNLSSSKRGEIKWSLTVNLLLLSGEKHEETVQVEGTPQDTLITSPESPTEVEEVLEKDGVRARLLLDTERPRLGTLLRLGVEIRAMDRQKTGVAGLSAQPNPAVTLRPLRRVRVELFRKIRILTPSTSSEASSSTSSPVEDRQHLTLLYASGKSLRYPGMNSRHLPLRVLFTIPTTQLGSGADQPWGEITISTPYHDVQFFVRVSIGFDGPGSDWVLEKPVTVRPKIWKEPRTVVPQRGQQPVLGEGDSTAISEDSFLTDEEVARESYRLKGQDTVGTDGTVRPQTHTPGEDLPPPFEGEGERQGGAGPSGGRLPTFLESEAQVRRMGEVVLPSETVTRERLVPIDFGNGDGGDNAEGEVFDRATMVGPRGSLGGELGTWVEVS